MFCIARFCSKDQAVSLSFWDGCCWTKAVQHARSYRSAFAARGAIRLKKFKNRSQVSHMVMTF